jgi:basic amino acid/polyamine antiporter, APA family
LTEAAPNDDRPRGAPLRRLGLFTVLCIGINNLVGTGIYQKPGQLAHALGGASWLAFAADALLLVVVALSFSTMSARHAEAGGPYVYAKEALGRWPAFIVAWTAWISMWAAAAAVTTTLPGQLAVFLPAARAPGGAIAIGLATLALFGLVNCVGLKPAAGASNLLTVAKLLPLAIFVVAGACHLLAAPAAAGGAPTAQDGLLPAFAGGLPAGPFARALGAAMFAGFYALQGFEVVPVPAAELKRPRRDVPIAVTGALVLTAVIYCLIQVVAARVAPILALASETGADGIARIAGPHFGPTRDALLAASGIAGAAPDAQLTAVMVANERPLAEAATHVMGPFGGALMAAGACLSFLGFAAVTILVAPRFLVALANDGMLPASIGRHHARFGTPVVAVVVTCLSAAVGGLLAGAGGLAAERFDRITALSNVAVLVQYSATCLAVLRLPAEPGMGAARRLVARRVLPIGGLGVCLLFGWLIATEPDPIGELLGFFGWTVAGVVLAWFTLRLARRAAGRSAAGGEGRTRIYAAPAAQPYVWSPLERESLKRTRSGGPNPWGDAAAVAHAQMLARSIRERWRATAPDRGGGRGVRDDRELLDWIAAQAKRAAAGSPLDGISIVSPDELERLPAAALRELHDRLGDSPRAR